MRFSIPDLMTGYDRVDMGGPPPRMLKNSLDDTLPTGTAENHGKTIEEEDQEMFTRYWRNVRKARKQRNYKDAFWWLEQMKRLKRFMNGTKQSSYPEVYHKCHRVLVFMCNINGGPELTYEKVSDLWGGSAYSASAIIKQYWQALSTAYVEEIYNTVLPIAKQEGYDE